MFFGFFMICSIDLAIAAVFLVLGGSRLHHASRLSGALLVLVVAFASGQVAEALWNLPSGIVESADVFVAVVGLAVVAVRPVWNAIGQLFFAAFLAGSLAYLAFAVEITVAGGLTVLGSIASAALLLVEISALTLATSFAFETCDVVCRVRHSRQFPEPDPAYLPKVSLHIAAYNEPPDMLIKTIQSVEGIDYPDFELIVIDNNTEDEDTWRPVEEYCRDKANVTFVHVNPWPGYKSGALNLALERYVDPAAEIIGVIDADYLVDPGYLRNTVGYFADPQVAFVQTPQDYRDYEGSAYLTACYDAYRYFFATAMPSRNERDSIIFAGTMGLLRRRLLEEIGGWDEWCITEDAETSLRLLKAGYQGMFVSESFGRGIMPLTFASLKSQRFRWCFGGMQILRRHWKTLMPWDRSPDNHLTFGQRVDYLLGGLQWLNDLVLLLFALILLVMGGLLLGGAHVAIRPLVGPTLLLPATLLISGLLRALWALRLRTGISYRRAFLAFANWLSLSYTVAWACLQGLIRSEGVFLRTPKTAGVHHLRAALVAARTEAILGAAVWACGISLLLLANPTPLLAGLTLWQGAVYWTAPYMAWLAQRTQLSPELERRRRTEERRERLAAVLKPVAIGTTAAAGLGAVAFVAILAVGAGHSGQPHNPFSAPTRSASDHGPWGGVLAPAAKTSNTSKSHQPGSTSTTTLSSTSTTLAPTSTTVGEGSPTTVPPVSATTSNTTVATTVPTSTGTSSPASSPPTTLATSATTAG